jgi:hypothetical protein
MNLMESIKRLEKRWVVTLAGTDSVKRLPV